MLFKFLKDNLIKGNGLRKQEAKTAELIFQIKMNIKVLKVENLKKGKAGFYFSLVIFICFILDLRSPPHIDFVRVEGTKFMIGNDPYYFAGINFWQGAYLGADLAPGGRDRLQRELDLLKLCGINNLRIMASSEQSMLKMSVSPAFQLNPGVYNEDLLEGLDYLLSEMGKRNMRAVMVMNNYWQWSGGMAQYINWATNNSIIDPDVTGNWHGFMNFSGDFYSTPGARKYFLKYLEDIITRKNTISHQFYYEDPTIMTWELANEPRPHPQSLDNKELLYDYYKWIESTSGFIHELAPKQLVALGSEGLAGTLQDSSIYFKIHDFSSVDYVTFHLWPKNWGWFMAEQQVETLPIALDNALKYCRQHIMYAELLNKPTVLEEFGIGRDSERYLPGTSVMARDTFLKMIFDFVEENIHDQKPLAGTNVWTWGGEGRSNQSDARWIAGDDFTGDPPQEPQGLNSIFDIDSTTLAIMKQHSRSLNMIHNNKYE
jgi:mannan endo-1,4-beta-mannosidase